LTDQLAISGGTPLRTRPFPAWPQWTEEEAKALIETLESGAWWAPEGTQVHCFEQEFAAAHQARFGVAVTNGSAALEVCLRAAQVDWGDEVITTPYTFIATASACLLTGAIPRFVDVLPDSWNLDPSQVEALITKRTRAILAVHIGGEPCDMEALRSIAERHQLLLIEDACQAHGASFQGHKVGALGDMGCFSFQASKNISAGEGGIILTNSESWAEKCWSVANVGRRRHGEFYQHIGLASNYRLSEWAGAVLRVQLKRMEDQLRKRQANARYLAKALTAVEGLEAVPGDPRVSENAHHLFKLWYYPEAFGGHSAAEFAKAMRAEGIPLTTGYPMPLSRHPVIVERIAYICRALNLPLKDNPPVPVCEEVCRRGMWIRQSVLLAEQHDMDDIVAAALKIQRAWLRQA